MFWIWFVPQALLVRSYIPSVAVLGAMANSEGWTCVK